MAILPSSDEILGIGQYPDSSHAVVTLGWHNQSMKKIMLVGLLLVSSLVVAQTKRGLLDHWQKMPKSIYDTSNRKIMVQDVKNDYLEFNGGKDGFWEGTGEFAVWRKKNGTDLIGITATGCGPACTTTDLIFAIWNGKTYTKQNNTIPKFSSSQLGAMLGVYNKKRSEEKIALAEQGWYFKFPQTGTTVEVLEPLGEFALGYYKFNGSGFIFEVAK